MEQEIQQSIYDAIQKSIDKAIEDIKNPKFEFVATYDAGI